MRIKANIEKIPGGLMIVPLFLGILTHTFFPNSAEYFGSFTKGIMTGSLSILAVWLFCLGTTIRFNSMGSVIRKSSVIIVTKLGVAWIIAIACARILPSEGITQGFFAGLSTLAIVAAMDMTNGGLYASIMNQYGTKAEAAACAPICLESGPLVTMIILGASGVATFDIQILIGALLPFMLGIILGNLDPCSSEFFSKGVDVLIPFFAFALGSNITLWALLQSGLLGILLGFCVIICTGVPLIFADRYLGGGDGTAGLAASSTASAAVSTPFLIAEVVPEFKSNVESATALVTASVIITSIFVPIITSIYSQWIKKRDKQQINN